MNSLILLLAFSVPMGQDPLSRVIFDVEIIQGERRVAAKMVLNQLNDQSYSITCRKNTAGTLFTYWATAKRNTLYFPREQVAFVGNADEDYRLFPDGPALSRDQWMTLLFEHKSVDMGPFTMRIDETWRELSADRKDWRIRWRERARSTKNRYSSRVLTPTLKSGTSVKTMDQMRAWWTGKP